MATNKVKFEMTLKELTFKFEGDYEKGTQLQQGISRTLGDFARLQNQASGTDDPRDAKPVSATVVDGKTARRRRRRPSPASGAEGASDGDGEGGENGQRKSSGISIKQLLLDLKAQQFFQQPHTNSQVVAELNRKGHTHIRDNHLTSPLKRLCTADILRREQNAEGVWTYLDGPNNA